MNAHRSFWRITTSLVLLGLSTVAVAGGTTPPAAATGPVQFMDLQWLKSGVSAQQAGDYFTQKLDPIVRKHGGRVVFTYQIVNVMKGEVKPAVIASMEFPSMDDMQALFKDPEYQKIVPQRDATFDLPRMSLFQIAPFSGS